MVDVNRALAVGMRLGALAGLDELDALPERELIARYHYALATYAELHASLGHMDEALSGSCARAADVASRAGLASSKAASLDR